MGVREHASAASCNCRSDSKSARLEFVLQGAVMNVRLPPVLVVDDEKNMRLSLKTVLADERYPVRTVESAEEALSLLDREEFFMVITDARLGGMSGYEVMAKTRVEIG